MLHTKELYCVETLQQVQVGVPLIKGRGASAVVLALTPEVHYALEKAGVQAKQPEDYHTEKEIHFLGMAQLAVVDRLCGLVDEATFSEVEAFRARDIRLGRLLWYELKNLLNSVAVRTLIMARILDVEKPNAVRYFLTMDEEVPTSLQFVNESIWSRVIPVVCKAKHTIAEAVSPPESQYMISGPAARGADGKGSTPGRNSGAASSSHRFSQVIRLLRSGLNRVKRGIAVQGPFRPGKQGQTLLTLTTAYSLSHLIEEADNTKQFRVLLFNPRRPWSTQWLLPITPAVSTRAVLPLPDGVGGRLDAASRRLRANAILEELLTISGVPYIEAVENRLHRLFSTVAPEVFYTYSQTEQVLRENSPAVMVAATMNLHERVAFLAARAGGVPTVVFQHGATAANALMETQSNFVRSEIDFRWSDYVFTFGEGDTRFFQKFAPGMARPISVGSPALDRLRQLRLSEGDRSKAMRRLGLDPKRPAVFYVPTSMDGNTRPIPTRNRSPARMFQIERAIADVASEHPGIQFVVKLHSVGATSPIERYIEDRHYTNCKVVRGKFQGMVHLADALIVDMPGLVFLEMLTTDRPILFCGHELPQKFNSEKWHPSILPMWKERVLYAEHLDEFLEMLRDFLRKGEFAPVKSSDEMLRLFGTHLDDGRSAERALAILMEIAVKGGVQIPNEHRLKQQGLSTKGE